MAARQSSPLCAPLGLLLLLIGVISSHLTEVQARPTHFWCNSPYRNNFEKRTEELKEHMANCVGSDMLSSPIQLPCVWIHTAEWENKTLQQKHAEVVGALQVFQDGVKRARTQTTLQCQNSLLGKFGTCITNYLVIVTSIQATHMNNDTVTPSAVQTCSSQTSLNKVLEQYRMLLKGKLERLAIDLQDSICKVEQWTTNTKGPLG